MIKYKTGNLLDITDGVIIHGCNAQGVMGSGVALAVKEKYPKAYQAYKAQELAEGLGLGTYSSYKHNASLSIANVVTQQTYGRDPNVRYVSYGAVLLGLECLNSQYLPEVTFHFPKIGAGLGNGNWNIIKELIELACPNRELVCWCL